MQVVRKRHVFYVEGYDPQGVAGYYSLFRREFERFKKLWPVRGTVGPAVSEADGHAARWQIETEGPNWKVSVAYEFLNWDDIIARDLARPMLWRFRRAAVWLLGDVFTGTTFRIFRASWRFGLFYLYPLIALALWLALVLAAGGVAACIAIRLLGANGAAATLVGIAAAVVTFWLLRRPAERGFVIQLTDLWLFFRDLTFGRRKDFEQRVDRFAERVVAAAQAGDCDEIVIVGHSGGAVAAALVVARAAAIDPELGRRGPRLVLLTLGSIMPAVAMHPAAVRLRDTLRALARQPDLLWIDCQSRKDVVNFYNFDPIVGVGIDAGPERRNPSVLAVRFSEALKPETYERFRWSLFRVHFQFIMANDLPAPYDYFFYLCGPLTMDHWLRHQWGALLMFDPDVSLREKQRRVAAS